MRYQYQMSKEGNISERKTKKNWSFNYDKGYIKENNSTWLLGWL